MIALSFLKAFMPGVAAHTQPKTRVPPTSAKAANHLPGRRWVYAKASVIGKASCSQVSGRPSRIAEQVHNRIVLNLHPAVSGLRAPCRHGHIQNRAPNTTPNTKTRSQH